jgi:hypothetical protein
LSLRTEQAVDGGGVPPAVIAASEQLLRPSATHGKDRSAALLSTSMRASSQ